MRRQRNDSVGSFAMEEDAARERARARAKAAPRIDVKARLQAMTSPLAVFPDACPDFVAQLTARCGGDIVKVVNTMASTGYLRAKTADARTRLAAIRKWWTAYLRRVFPKMSTPSIAALASLLQENWPVVLRALVRVHAGSGKEEDFDGSGGGPCAALPPDPMPSLCAQVAADVWARHYEREARSAAARLPALGTVRCAICYDAEVPTALSAHCHLCRSHTVCLECLRSTVLAKLWDGHGNHASRCVYVEVCKAGKGERCPGTYAYPYIRAAVDDAEVEQAQARAETQAAVRAAGLEAGVTCPRCGYMELGEETGTGTTAGAAASAGTFECADCGLKTCLWCGARAHAPLTCAEAVARTKSSAEAAARRARDEALSQVVVRTCPCGKEFVKEDGCNKVVCVCGSVLCYLCRAVIPGYSHFCDTCPGGKPDASLEVPCTRCHLFTDHAEGDAAACAAIEAAKK